MTSRSVSRTGVSLLLTVLLPACLACVSPQVVSRPGWVDNPPDHDAWNLYFTGGSGLRPSETAARDAAESSALGKIPRFIASDVSVTVEDVRIRENGVGSSRFVISAKIAGKAVTIRGARAASFFCTGSGRGFDCAALVSYPREEYDRVMTEIALAEKEYAGRQEELASAALGSYEKAVALESQGMSCLAVESLREAAGALKDIDRPVSLSHREIPNSDLLGREVSTLLGVAGKACEKTKNWLAVRILIDVDGVESAAHAQGLFAAVSGIAAKYRFESNRDVISSADAALCLAGNRQAALKAAGGSRYLLVIRASSAYQMDRFEREFYSRSGADWALVDPSTGAVLASGAPSDVRGTGISRADACGNAVDKLWSGHLAPTLDKVISGLKR